MKVGIDITSFHNGNSGIQIYIRNILSELQNCDKTNHYFLFERYASGYRAENPLWKVITWKAPKFPFSQTIWFNVIFPLLLKKNKVEVVWSPDYFCPYFLPKKTKIILTIYDCTYFRFPETMDKSLLRTYNLFLRKSIKKAETIMTISGFTAKELTAVASPAAGKRIVIVPCGKPEWRLPEPYEPQRRQEFLFFAGNFEPRKNILNLIKAMEILHNKSAKVSLHIAGQKGWRNEEIFHYISNSRIKENVVFLGYISEQQLIEQYCTCKALVFPSLYEGFGMPVLESLSLDCLVLTSKGTVMQEICGESALYFDPHDPADIARAIEMVFRNDFDRNIYLQHRQMVLDQYDWKTSAEKIRRELVEERNHN